MTTPAQPATLTLTQLPKGAVARIACCGADGDCAREMLGLGLEPNAMISLCRRGATCVVRVHHPCGGSCRIGIARDIADRITVTTAAPGLN